MKLVTYQGQDGHARVGRLEGPAVIDAGFSSDMVEFIAAGAPRGRELEVGTIDEVRLLAPLRPRTLRDFLAFEGHMNNAFSRLGKRIPQEWYDTPAYYKGLPNTVIGPEDVIPWPSYTDRLDHELELAVVLGAPGRDIPAGRADQHIFGYTIWNDLSARDVQTRELPVGMGPAKAKDWDGSNVLGPCIVTADEVHHSDIDLEVHVNGERWGGTNTQDMHHTVPAMIAYASQDLTLRPGEVIGVGTATGGSGLELDRWLSPGDRIEMTAHGIGTLRNTVGPRPTTAAT